MKSNKYIRDSLKTYNLNEYTSFCYFACYFKNNMYCGYGLFVNNEVKLK